MYVTDPSKPLYSLPETINASSPDSAMAARTFACLRSSSASNCAPLP